MKFYTPLRYPGGKAKFAPFIASIMESNELSGDYLEPYAGGAGVALYLLFNDIVPHIHINDFDPAIYDFWMCVTQYPDELLRLIHDTPVNMEQWYYWRNILRGEIKTSQVERGFATLFMNRTNRSGILKGGVIGGQKQNGNYAIDARYKKDVLKKRIEEIAKLSHKISVYNEDALQLLKNCPTFLKEKSLIYLDPPYYIKGKGLYRNFYEHDDHKQIAQQLFHITFDISWVVSYDNVSEIQEIYGLTKQLSYKLNYTAQKSYIGSEVMFFSNNIIPPSNEVQYFRLPLNNFTANYYS